MSLAYTRKFIILRKEFSTMAERNPKGHCKLEIKGLRGMVTVNVENAEADNFYNVVFISNDRLHSTWELGKIFTDDIGRGKGEFTFIQRDLEAKNFPIDRISGILVIREGEVLLGGYLDKEDGTIERYIESIHLKSESTINEIPAIAEVEEVAEMAEVESEVIEEVTEVAEIQETVEIEELEEVVREYIEENVQESVEEVDIEPLHDPIYDVPARELAYDPMYDIPATESIIEEQEIEVIEEIEEKGIAEPVVSENIQEEKTPEIKFDLEDLDEESMEPDHKTLDYIKKLNQKNQTTNYVLSILRFFPYIDPFKYNLKGYNWWIVELDKENEYRAFLPYFSYIVGGNNKEPYSNNIATCNELMSKYEHYLFGLYNEGENVKYFVYGIPGKFTMNEHPYRGANGFNTWHQGKYIEGYWIIYIDPMTGKPIRPVTPMIPVD